MQKAQKKMHSVKPCMCTCAFARKKGVAQNSTDAEKIKKMHFPYVDQHGQNSSRDFHIKCYRLAIH